MKKRMFLLTIIVGFCFTLFTGCDPVLPTENIDVICIPNPLNQGDSAVVEIEYPDINDTAVVKWTDQKIDIVQGDDIVEILGLTITGLKPGTAKLKVEVKANCSFMGIIIDKPSFSKEIEIEVK